nr:hypothetical protein [Planctomycetota bacterium]
MADPVLRSDGNLRFAGFAQPGYPEDPEALVERARTLLAGQDGVETYGPATILVSLPPEEMPPTWECQVGIAITGLARPAEGLAIEDYRALYALTLVHQGTIRDLAATHRRLADHGRSLGRGVRPYWRVALWR